MRSTWPVGRDSVRAVTRAPVSARAERSAKEACGCVAACAKGPGPSPRRRTTMSALYRRLAARRGSKRATIAVAHNLLVIAYYMLRDGTCYRDLGADYFDRLGFKVTLEPLAQVA